MAATYDRWHIVGRQRWSGVTRLAASLLVISRIVDLQGVAVTCGLRHNIGDEGGDSEAGRQLIRRLQHRRCGGMGGERRTTAQCQEMEVGVAGTSNQELVRISNVVDVQGVCSDLRLVAHQRRTEVGVARSATSSSGVYSPWHQRRRCPYEVGLERGRGSDVR
jgi:hypothetical protein